MLVGAPLYRIGVTPMKVQDQLLEKAIPFIKECYSELGQSSGKIEARLAEITEAIRYKGYYEQLD
jgi:nitric-oxide synthase, bacterial